VKNSEKYELVVGLEVHAQLMTASKLFCSDHATFGAPPNTQISAISLAHPGTLPTLNEKAIELAVKLGLTLHCNIEKNNFFARKNYFYPDLPKGYQITQHTSPICREGYLTIDADSGKRNILINRIHLEEDAGKSIHDDDSKYSSIDLNRAGVPLVEIVTEPVIHSAEEASTFLTELRKIVRWLEVCDGDMEKGSMRCDANVSIRIKGTSTLGKRVEVKNLNSIKHVKKAILFEFDRLVALAENNTPILQETRSYDADQDITFSLRSKEQEDDYRYFPEPDLPPFILSDAFIQQIADNLPAMPEELKANYIKEYGLSEYDATMISNDLESVVFFKRTIEHTNAFKAVVNWMAGPIKEYCNENNITLSSFSLSPFQIASLIYLTETGKVSFSNASGKIFTSLLNNPNKNAEEIANELNLIQEDNTETLDEWIKETILSMPDKVIEYQSGKKGLLGLFAGEVKKRSHGKADMKLITQMLIEKLNHPN